MRALRVAGGALAGLLILLALAAWLAPPMLDWNQYRDAIANVASHSLGRPVQIQGPVSLTLLPTPVLTASNVVLPDAGDGFSAGVAALQVQVALSGLLTGHLEAEDLTLHGARMRLPWPFRPGALQQDRPDWLNGLHAQLEDGTLLIGQFVVTELSGSLAADPLTGTFSMDGMAATLGRRWRVTARLGRPGGDSVAPLELSLDGQDATQDTGGTFSGQLMPDGTLAGRVTGRGKDVSQLIAGPTLPWHASGRFRGADGLALADDLDVEIGGVPARGALALRLLPHPRLDAALAASRLDLAAWLPNVLRGGATTIPTTIDLSAEAATLAGGTLRQTRLAFDLTPDGATVREASAILPGDAVVNLTGRLTGGRFDGAGSMKAPDMRATLAWLQPLAPGLVAGIPPNVMRTATLTARVAVARGALTLDGLDGVVDGGKLAGALTVTPGSNPALNGNLTLEGLNLDQWLPPTPVGLQTLASALSTWPGSAAGLNLQLAVKVARPIWHGAKLDQMSFDAALQGGTLTVHQAKLTGADLDATLAGTLAPGGRITDGRLDATLGHAAALAALLPPDWPQGLLQGEGSLHVTVGGSPGAMGVTAQAALGDLRLDARGTADLANRAWKGNVDFHHPGAPRLLEAAGVRDVASWLGDGSLSLTTVLTADPAHIAASGFSLSAGEMRMSGDLQWDPGPVPALHGQVAAEMLPLPLPYIRSPTPLPVEALRGWQGQVAVKAAHVLVGLSPAFDNAEATMALAGGALHVNGLAAEVAGGKLTATMEVSTQGVPHLSAEGTLTGAALSGTVLDTAVDLVRGRVDASATVTASGFSPGALLATLGGTGHATVTGGSLMGFDLAAVDAALGLPDAAATQTATQALQGGRTDFAKLSLDLVADHGAVAVSQGALQSDAGTATLAGTWDLPNDAVDMTCTLTPARPGAPIMGLRLIGPSATPRRTPELAALAGWLAAR